MYRNKGRRGVRWRPNKLKRNWHRDWLKDSIWPSPAHFSKQHTAILCAPQSFVDDSQMTIVNLIRRLTDHVTIFIASFYGKFARGESCPYVIAPDCQNCDEDRPECGQPIGVGRILPLLLSTQQLQNLVSGRARGRFQRVVSFYWHHVALPAKTNSHDLHFFRTITRQVSGLDRIIP